MDKLRYIKIQEKDGSYSAKIPLAIDAENILLQNGDNLQFVINYLLNTDKQVKQIRLGGNNVLYSSAGKAVQEQYKELKKSIQNQAEARKRQDLNKVNKPQENPLGVEGQVLVTNGDGTTSWESISIKIQEVTSSSDMVDINLFYRYKGSQPNFETNKIYYWDGSNWVTFGSSGVTGVKGNAEATYRKGNVNLTKEDIGLGNVDNTADVDKPISHAVEVALNDKADLYYDTTQGWNQHPDLVSEEGTVYIYSDYKQDVDQEFRVTNIPGIKIGDGLTKVVNLPFVASEETQQIIDDYNLLKNRPQIQGVTLEGNKTFPELELDTLSNLEIEAILNLADLS